MLLISCYVRMIWSQLGLVHTVHLLLKHFLKTGESLIVTHSAFHAHFTNDTIVAHWVVILGIFVLKETCHLWHQWMEFFTTTRNKHKTPSPSSLARFMLYTSGLCRKYRFGQLNENRIVCPCVCVCGYLHVNKVYQINGSIVGWSKEDKNLTLLTYMGMCVCSI